MKTQSSHTADIRLMYMLTFISGIGNPLVLPCFPMIMSEFGLSPLELSLVITTFAVPALFSVPLSGVLSDRIGRKPVILLMLVLGMLGFLLGLFAPSFGVLLAGRMLQGFAIAPLESLGNTLATDSFSGLDRSRHIVRNTAVQYSSVAITPLLVSLAMLFLPWRFCFCLGVLFVLAALFLVIPASASGPARSGTGAGSYVRQLGSVFGSLHLFLLFLVRICSALAIFGVLYPHLSLLVCNRMGADASTVGPFFSMYAFGTLAGSLSVNMISRHLDQPRLALVGGAVLTASMLLFDCAYLLWHAGLATIMLGWGYGILVASCSAHVSQATTAGTRGAVMSAYSLAFRLSQSVAPVLFGLVFTAGSFTAVFRIGAVVAVVMMLVAAWTYRNPEAVEQAAERHF